MRKLFVVALPVLVLSIAAAAVQTLDSAKSKITAVFTQFGVPVEVSFNRFTAQISFNPAAIADSKAQLQVDMASFDMGDAEYNMEVLRKEWFNAAQYPQATFLSNAIKQTGPGKLEVTGTLTLKGKSQMLTAPVSFRQEGAERIYEGQLTIKRNDFSIGEGVWKDTGTVADPVLIKFKVVTAGQ
jgi:polyisoprenoid-binding protein YceI